MGVVFAKKELEWEEGLTWEEWPIKQKLSKCQFTTETMFNPTRCAYVSLIYGCKVCEALMQAIPLGCSLAMSGTTCDRILLHTTDVPTSVLEVLKPFWTKHIIVPYLSAEKTLWETVPHFKWVFTKLNIFNKSLLNYDKVVYLDLDMIVLHNVDDLFEINAPAAVPCYSSYNEQGGKKLIEPYCEGMLMKAGTTFNGGVLLVEPNQNVFEVLCADAKKHSTWHVPTTYPETHYLKHITTWHALCQTRNMSPRLGKGQSLTPAWLDSEFNNISIVHFSDKSKPYNWLKKQTIDAIPRKEMLATHQIQRVQQRADMSFKKWIEFGVYGIIGIASKMGWRPWRELLIASRVFQIASKMGLSSLPMSVKKTLLNIFLRAAMNFVKQQIQQVELAMSNVDRHCHYQEL